MKQKPLLFTQMEDRNAWPAADWADVVWWKGTPLIAIPHRWWSVSQWLKANEGCRNIRRFIKEKNLP